MNFQFLASLSAVWTKAWPILVAILFFGFIIFIHEFGHFIFAKLFGVQVNEFALGMGPTIFKIQGKKTKYALRLFPIGGFVSMEGEDENSEDQNAFCNKALWKRMIIVVAGATFNIILGIVICCFLVGNDQTVGTNQILQFHESAVSNSENGLKESDKILKIDGKRIFSDYDISFLMQRNNTGKYHFVVERDGEKVDLPEVNFARRTGGNFSYNQNLEISSLSAKMKRAKLEEGDKVLKINGEKIKTQEEMISAIGKDEDKKIDFVVLRNQGEVEVKDVQLAMVTVFDFVILGQEKDFGNVVGGGFKYALSMSRLVYLSLFDLVRGNYGINDIAGPIGTVSVITDIAEESAQTADLSGLLMIMALITINIGLFNLLPIPALDGGRFFFMLVELVFRKPIPAKYENWVHSAGMILLFAFMALIAASDLWKLISGVGFY